MGILLGVRAQKGRRATLVCAGYGHTSSAAALLLLRLRRRPVRELERRGDIAPEAPDDVRWEDEPKAGGVASVRNVGNSDGHPRGYHGVRHIQRCVHNFSSAKRSLDFPPSRHDD